MVVPTWFAMSLDRRRRRLSCWIESLGSPFDVQARAELRGTVTGDDVSTGRQFGHVGLGERKVYLELFCFNNAEIQIAIGTVERSRIDNVVEVGRGDNIRDWF